MVSPATNDTYPRKRSIGMRIVTMLVPILITRPVLWAIFVVLLRTKYIYEKWIITFTTLSRWIKQDMMMKLITLGSVSESNKFTNGFEWFISVFDSLKRTGFIRVIPSRIELHWSRCVFWIRQEPPAQKSHLFGNRTTMVTWFSGGVSAK